MSYEFYSTTREHRIAEIERINDDQPILRVRDLLDDISDGCGGCERMMVSTAAGHDGWISVLADQGNRVWYCFIEVEDLRTIELMPLMVVGHPAQRVVRATYGSLVPQDADSQDSWGNYLLFLEMIEEADQEEE